MPFSDGLNSNGGELGILVGESLTRSSAVREKVMESYSVDT